MNREIEIQIKDREGCVRKGFTRTTVYPGGELRVETPGIFPNVDGAPPLQADIHLIARLQNSEDVMRLWLTVDLVHRWIFLGRKTLMIPYMPYARQDRCDGYNNVFSLPKMAQIINMMCFDEVIFYDGHSPEIKRFVINATEVRQIDIVRQFKELNSLLIAGAYKSSLYSSQLAVLAPDAGAAKKSLELAQLHGLSLFQALKERDLQTGKLAPPVIVNGKDLKGKDVIICDDICDGGATFLNLAEALKEYEVGELYLYVTHGIFSNGISKLLRNFKKIFTTDSFLASIIRRDNDLVIDETSGLVRSLKSQFSVHNLNFHGEAR